MDTAAGFDILVDKFVKVGTKPCVIDEYLTTHLTVEALDLQDTSVQILSDAAIELTIPSETQINLHFENHAYAKVRYTFKV